MIPYQLPNGKTIMLSLDDLLNMEDAQELIAKDRGFYIESDSIDLDLPELPKEEWSPKRDNPLSRK